MLRIPGLPPLATYPLHRSDVTWEPSPATHRQWGLLVSTCLHRRSYIANTTRSVFGRSTAVRSAEASYSDRRSSLLRNKKLLGLGAPGIATRSNLRDPTADGLGRPGTAVRNPGCSVLSSSGSSCRAFFLTNMASSRNQS